MAQITTLALISLLSLMVTSEQNIDSSLNSLSQDDGRLIETLRKHILVPPVDKTSRVLNVTVTYNDGTSGLTYLYAQSGQPTAIDTLLHKIYQDQVPQDGFYVEAGAWDGATYSNSLLFEVKYGWSGLLAEPNPDVTGEIVGRGRNAWILPHCLSTTISPQEVTFDAAGLFGGIEKGHKKPGDAAVEDWFRLAKVARRSIQVQCFPLYSVLLACGTTKINYLSLDIEGSELQVLQTIPFEQLDIEIISVEVNHLGQVFDGSSEDLYTFMHAKGYKLYQRVDFDVIFVKKSLLLRLPK